jgi:Flp pilus assembly protein TadB
MAKNRYGKAKGGMQGNMMYNRPSGGYQKNLYRQQMLANNVKRPQTLTQKTLRIILIVAGVLWAALTVFLTVKMKWTGLLIGMVVLLLLTGCLWLYLRYTQKQMIKYYKQIGMTEEMYVRELKKRNVDKKQIDQVRKTWKKVKAEPVVGNNQKKK